MFGFPKKETKVEAKEETDPFSQEKLVAKLKGEPFSQNYYRIEVREQNGKIQYVSQLRYFGGTDTWYDRGIYDNEKDARRNIAESKKGDYEKYLKDEEKKKMVVVRHIDC